MYTAQYVIVDPTGQVEPAKSPGDAHYLALYRTLPDGTSQWVADFDTSETNLVFSIIGAVLK